MPRYFILPAELRTCLEAFERGDNAACLNEAQELLHRSDSPPPVVLHLALISLQRLGRVDEASALAAERSPTLNDSWEQILISITQGSQPPAAYVFEMADDEIQRCRAHGYAGIRLLTMGDRAGAVEHLVACRDDNPFPCLEQMLATMELNRFPA